VRQARLRHPEQAKPRPAGSPRPAAVRLGPGGAPAGRVDGGKKWDGSIVRPQPVEPDRARQVGQRERCGDDDGGERRLGQVARKATSLVTWVFAPACSATAVRGPQVLTENPWNRPAAMFAAPMPVISRPPSTVRPVRAANDEPS
jgi:hypothetical protein